MKNILLLVVATLISLSLVAQTTDIYNQLKIADRATGNAVSINEQDEIKNIAAAQNPIQNSINGYRVRIFFDNGQSARSSAEEIQEEFESLYPLIPCNLIYENPYFKVTVGNCLSIEEAIMLWSRVQTNFDRAFVIREDIAFESLQTPVSSADQALDAAIAKAAAEAQEEASSSEPNY